MGEVWVRERETANREKPLTLTHDEMVWITVWIISLLIWGRYLSCAQRPWQMNEVFIVLGVDIDIWVKNHDLGESLVQRGCCADSSDLRRTEWKTHTVTMKVLLLFRFHHYPGKGIYEDFTDLITEENIKGEEEDGHTHYHAPHRFSQTLQESRWTPSMTLCVPIPTILTWKLQQNNQPTGQAAGLLPLINSEKVKRGWWGSEDLYLLWPVSQQ